MIWVEVNFWVEFNWFDFGFSSPRLVTIPSLNSLGWSTIYSSWRENSLIHIFPKDIYIYIYIVIHRQTVSFYQNSSEWLDTQDARNPSNFTLDCVSDHSATKRTTLAKGILRYFIFRNSSSSFWLHFFFKNFFLFLILGGPKLSRR